MATLDLGNVDITDILAEISEDVGTETLEELAGEPNLSEDELAVLEKQNEFALKSWNIVSCKVCRNIFDMLNCKYDEGNLVCPRCQTVQI